MKFVLALTAVLAVLPSVLGHATLVYPAPFGTPNSPSKTSPTGGGSSGTPIYPFTGAQYLDWKLIAGDGNGPVRMVINSAGNGAFTTATTAPTGSTLTLVTLTPVTTAACQSGTCATYTTDPAGGPQTPSNNPYEFTFTVPAGIQCTGTMGNYQGTVCTVQISSSSSWYSGFAFSTAPPAAGATLPAQTLQLGTCESPNPTALATCSKIVKGIAAVAGSTSNKIWVPQGTDQATMDASVRAEIDQNLPNPNVFSVNTAVDVTPSHVESFSVATPCSTSYTQFLCAQAFTPCNAANTQPASGSAGQPCGPNCDEFTCWCNLNPKHKYLYSCTSYSNAGRDSTGRCTSYPNVRGFGPNNSTCVASTNTNTDGTTCADSLCAGVHTAALQPIVLAVAAVATALAVYLQ